MIRYQIEVIEQHTYCGMDGHVWKPENCYYNVQRDDHEKLQAAIWRVSYLAKGRGKGYRPEQTKNYSTSRIKPLTAQR